MYDLEVPVLSQGLENGEGFILQYAPDGSWFRQAKKFVKGADWNGNNAWKSATVVIDASSINSIKLQFRGTMNLNNEKMYIDNVVFQGLA